MLSFEYLDPPAERESPVIRTMAFTDVSPQPPQNVPKRGSEMTVTLAVPAKIEPLFVWDQISRIENNSIKSIGWRISIYNDTTGAAFLTI